MKITKKIYNFINIDIQGYELEALKGLTDQLIYLDYIYLEINFSELYKNCSKVKDVDRFLEKYSFKELELINTATSGVMLFMLKNSL